MTPAKPARARSASGHLSRVFVRFDDTNAPAFTPAAQGLYYNRNRWYSPALGRFTTKDPNETSLLLITVTAMNGEALGALVGSFDAQGHFGDGMNLYLFAASNPITGTDSLGTMLGGLGTGAAQSTYLWALAAGSVAGGAGYFASGVMQGMALRDAAIEAACFGAAAFMTGSVIGEIWFAAAHDVMGVSAATGAGSAGLVTLYEGPILGTLRFGEVALRRMTERNIHRIVVEEVLLHGSRAPDPQGTAHMYIYRMQMWINGRDREVEVLWSAVTNTVYHVLYRTP